MLDGSESPAASLSPLFNFLKKYPPKFGVSIASTNDCACNCAFFVSSQLKEEHKRLRVFPVPEIFLSINFDVSIVYCAQENTKT